LPTTVLLSPAWIKTPAWAFWAKRFLPAAVPSPIWLPELTLLISSPSASPFEVVDSFRSIPNQLPVTSTLPPLSVMPNVRLEKARFRIELPAPAVATSRPFIPDVPSIPAHGSESAVMPQSPPSIVTGSLIDGRLLAITIVPLAAVPSKIPASKPTSSSVPTELFDSAIAARRLQSPFVSAQVPFRATSGRSPVVSTV
jgi:hypothetical protein